MKCLAEKIRSIRQYLGFTQSTVAEHMQVSRSLYAKYELDRVDPPLEVVVRICRYFHVSADELLGLTEEERHRP